MILILSVIILTIILIAFKFGYFSSFQQNDQDRPFSKSNLPKNLSLHICPNSTSSARPLAVIFSWINAKNKNLDKFKQIWFEKGFDVLIVRTSVFETLLPPIGSQIVAKNVVKVLSDLNSEYNEIVVHAFSVGGYQFGEVLVQLTAEEKHTNILNSFKGFIMDSIVYSKDRAPGMSRTLTSNQILRPMIERSIEMFFNLFHNFIVKHYNKSEDLVVNPVVNYAGLIFYSKNDLMSVCDSNENLVKMWTKRGNDIRAKCWDESGHVLHYRHYQQEYEQELDQFVSSLNLKNT